MATATWDRHKERGKDKGSDRGRNARRPSEIPKAGWKDTLYRVKSEIKDDKVSMIAAAMSYYALFAIVPAISSIVFIYAFFSNPADIQNHLNVISEFIPPQMQEFLQTTLSSLAQNASGVGWGAIFSLLISLWSASKGSKSLIDALNMIYDQEERRGFFKYNGLALALTLFAVILSIVAIAVVVGLPAVFNMLNLPGALQAGVGVLSWLVLLALFSLFLSVAYRFCPNRKKAQWKWVSWGAIIASVLFAITSGLFSWYAKEFADFNKTYGSLGAVIVLMTWFYLSSFVVLMGGEINAEMEHQTAHDTTEPEDQQRPMGSRNARMADTLGDTKEQMKRAD